MRIKIPETPPEISFTPEVARQYMEIVGNDQFINIIQKANREYYYWDDFKYKFPDELGSPEFGWMCLKMSRRTQVNPVKIYDKDKNVFHYWIPSEVVKRLQFLDSQAVGQIFIEEPILNMEEKDKYLANSLMEEAISSSILEGAATTREKAKELLLSGKKPRSQPDIMVSNNYRTIKKIRSLKNQPLTVEMLHAIHLSITEDTLKDPSAAGRFRKEGDKQIVVGDDYGNTLFIPPKFEELKDRIQQMIDFANEEDPDQEFIHPVIKAIILHFTLAYIHPYVDGNGRTARALFYWFMLKKGYWLTEYVSISRLILKSPSQYAKAYLYTEMDDQDLTYFIHYHLKVLCQGIEELEVYIAKQQKRIQKFSKSIREFQNLNSRQTRLLEHAFKHPNYNYTFSKHKNYHGISNQTARTDILELVKEGFLKQNDRKIGSAFAFSLDKNFENSYEKYLKS